ncbi:NAD(P)-dependent oxidoreductase [Humitalea rosea]|nr:NAD(P)-dependent oxidoreductase [Humitalea rosea]
MSTTTPLQVFLTHTEEEFAAYYGPAGLAGLLAHARVVRNTTGRVLAGRELAEAAAGCQVIVAHRSAPGNAETFAHAPALLAFLRGAVDISTIDVPAASAVGVLVTRATPGFTDAVAELAIGMMVDLARGVSAAVCAYRAGREPVPPMGMQLTGAMLGIMGYGRIARRLAQMALGIGMRVQVHDPYTPPREPGVAAVSFAEVLASSDVVVCLALSTPETAGLFDAGAFAAMKWGAIFINLSRGELVDEAALEATLDAGHLRGAAMDVGQAPDQRPQPHLARRADVVATPHIGGLTAEARDHQMMDTVHQVAALAAGRMPDGAVNAADARRLRQFWA